MDGRSPSRPELATGELNPRPSPPICPPSFPQQDGAPPPRDSPRPPTTASGGRPLEPHDHLCSDYLRQQQAEVQFEQGRQQERHQEHGRHQERQQERQEFGGHLSPWLSNLSHVLAPQLHIHQHDDQYHAPAQVGSFDCQGNMDAKQQRQVLSERRQQQEMQQEHGEQMQKALVRQQHILQHDDQYHAPAQVGSFDCQGNMDAKQQQQVLSERQQQQERQQEHGEQMQKALVRQQHILQHDDQYHAPAQVGSFDYQGMDAKQQQKNQALPESWQLQDYQLWWAQEQMQQGRSNWAPSDSNLPLGPGPALPYEQASISPQQQLGSKRVLDGDAPVQPKRKNQHTAQDTVDPQSELQPGKSLDDAAARQLPRGNVIMATRFIPLLDFLQRNPLTRPFKLKVGTSLVGVGGPDEIVGDADDYFKEIEIIKNTDVGDEVADGFTGEICHAHEHDLSWGGCFTVDEMFVSEKGSVLAYICVEPTLKATPENKYLDFCQLVTNLFSRYIDKNGRMPLYLNDFLSRVAQLLQQNEYDRPFSLWILQNHPFFMGPSKWRRFIEEFYSFYKSLNVAGRESLVRENDRSLYPRWHLDIVRTDRILDLVYWKGREGQRPDDYYTRDVNETSDNDEDWLIYPFTSEDGYLAIWQRHIFVHGLENIQEIDPEISLPYKQFPFLVAYYFEYFLPGFLIAMCTISEEHEHLEGAIIEYTKRMQCSWRYFSEHVYDRDAGDGSQSDSKLC